MGTSPTDVPFPAVPPVVSGFDPEAEPVIDYDSFVTVDHKPVDSIYIERNFAS
jgi:hypothetical protein